MSAVDLLIMSQLTETKSESQQSKTLRKKLSVWYFAKNHLVKMIH